MGRLARLRTLQPYKSKQDKKGVSGEELAVLSGDNGEVQEKKQESPEELRRRRKQR